MLSTEKFAAANQDSLINSLILIHLQYSVLSEKIEVFISQNFTIERACSEINALSFGEDSAKTKINLKLNLKCLKFKKKLSAAGLI